MPRGIQAIQQNSELLDAEKSSLIPCYIGSAPYWQVDSPTWADIAGKAIVISSLSEAREKIGFFKPSSGKWAKEYSICEAVYSHFGDKLNVVGPIVVLINAAAIEVEEEATSATLPMANGVGVINANGKVVLNTVSIADKVKGVDYSVAYDDNGRSIIITDLKKSLGPSANVTYKEVAGLNNLVMTSPTFDTIDYFEQTIGEVPTVFAAPGWEDSLIDGTEDGNSVGYKLMEIADGQINSHWYTQAYVQLASSSRTEIATEKAAKGYDSPKLKVCWPYVRKSGLIFHLVTKFIVAKMIVDIRNGNIPYESASNEILDIEGLCNASGIIILQNENAANTLNNYGVATCNFVMGAWRTWGVCMANYLESNVENILPEYLNDVAVQMRDYVSNDFQLANFDSIDKPIPVRKAKEIVDDYQVTLNSLVNLGALLFGEIKFQKSENSRSALANGEFVFSIAETNTPPGKSIIGKVQYTAEGLNSYFSEEE